MAEGSDLAARAAALVRGLGLCPADVEPVVMPLTGGVASDIARVAWPGGEACVKFALSRLRVAADWQVPVGRSAAEYAWLSAAGRLVPGCAPRLLGRDGAAGGFAMEFLAGPDVVLWKAALLSGASQGEEAAVVGDALGRIHAGSAAPGFDRTPFANAALFHAIRVEPYLLFTAGRHPALAPRLRALAEGLNAHAQTLVHGDVSPKNILIRAGRPVFLDAECATMGDPAFDVAFVLNHLVLKALHLPPSRRSLLAAVAVLWRAYRAHVAWEDPEAIEARVAALLPALMLARVDGKSPVEYLTPAGQAAARACAIPLVAQPAPSLARTLGDLGARMEAA